MHPALAPRTRRFRKDQNAAKNVSATPGPIALKPRLPGEDRRRQLLEVAVEVFSRKGFAGTKTKDIAAAAGVSEAILFRHFASKEDLYHAILDTWDAKDGAQRRIEELQPFA